MSRFQLGIVFLTLLLLRIVVGFHFFKEGTAKLKSGNFTAKNFFAESKGPLAPFFKDMLDDPDGEVKLCVKQSTTADGNAMVSIDPEFTFLIWNEYIDEATSYFGLGSPDLQEILQKRRETLATKIDRARKEQDSAAKISELERQRKLDEQNILAIREQPKKAEDIFENHQLLLADFLDGNKTELVSHFATADRLAGFDKDGESRREVASYVDSLRGQVDTIRSERKKKLQEWTAEVTSIWDSLEDQINSLAVDLQAERPRYPIHRPFDQENSTLKVIDQIIPWFDTVVGVLLLIGLFSRIASGAAAVFLASVIATQPPWVPGAAPTYFYFIELAACLVIFATCAGRFGGLDYFLSRGPKTVTTDSVATAQPAL